MDLGCGTGHVARALRRRYPDSRVIAVDMSLAMLRQAHAARNRARNPAYVCADAQCLPFADASAALICSNMALHWCHDLERALIECRRVLAPGGLLLMSTVGPDTLRELRTSWVAADGHARGSPYLDASGIAGVLARAGFTDPVVETEMMRFLYRDLAHLMRELKLMGVNHGAQGRPRGLGGRAHLQAAARAYEGWRTAKGYLPASFEVIYTMAHIEF